MNKKITTKTEYLSAFLDDEAGVFEKRRMLDEVQKDSELQRKIANYSLIGEAMRNENACLTVQPDFLAGLHEKLEEEAVYQKIHVKKAANSSSRAWLSPVTGMALAASLAAVTVVGVSMNQGSTSETPTVVAQHQVDTHVDRTQAVSPVQEPVTRVAYSALDMAWRKRLKGYVNSHAKYASTSAIMPSIRAASYASSY